MIVFGGKHVQADNKKVQKHPQKIPKHRQQKF